MAYALFQGTLKQAGEVSGCSAKRPWMSHRAQRIAETDNGRPIARGWGGGLGAGGVEGWARVGWRAGWARFPSTGTAKGRRAAEGERGGHSLGTPGGSAGVGAPTSGD
ncbi:hypothetical protein GCM10025873_13060 [Demequina sediminis]|nr:hypothetical protein GCM10025873_13060 [Demequina sediminis]